MLSSRSCEFARNEPDYEASVLCNPHQHLDWMETFWHHPHKHFLLLKEFDEQRFIRKFYT
jgi:CelD/BcsL family acetyltransferase involved in cellulose biosynthesis